MCRHALAIMATTHVMYYYDITETKNAHLRNNRHMTRWPDCRSATILSHYRAWPLAIAQGYSLLLIDTPIVLNAIYMGIRWWTDMRPRPTSKLRSQNICNLKCYLPEPHWATALSLAEITGKKYFRLPQHWYHRKWKHRWIFKRFDDMLSGEKWWTTPRC